MTAFVLKQNQKAALRDLYCIVLFQLSKNILWQPGKPGILSHEKRNRSKTSWYKNRFKTKLAENEGQK